MNIKIPNPFKTAVFSAWGFFFRALLILVVFMCLHLLGCREYTSFISGTTSGNFLDMLGMAYFLFYSLSVFVAPIFVLAAAFMAVVESLGAAEDLKNS
ncbi:MAG: hypothetical protein EOM80_13810 [Erysipelotrichia bacterium]|nr:hypothetical protein [Erysipelotrichia bacterium]